MCTSKDSDKPAHSCSLLRIFTGRILDRQGCKVFHAAKECADLSEPSLGAHFRRYGFHDFLHVFSMVCSAVPCKTILAGLATVVSETIFCIRILTVNLSANEDRAVLQLNQSMSVRVYQNLSVLQIFKDQLTFLCLEDVVYQSATQPLNQVH